MATNNWALDLSGSWGNAADWTTGAAPLVTDDVVINYAGITVSVGNGVAAVAHTLAVTNATFAITGGTLFTVQSANFTGAFVQTAGTYTMSGTGANFLGTVDFAGGTINVLSGAAGIDNSSSLAGTFTGNGALDIVAGSSYVNAGFACTTGSIVVGQNGGKLGFNISFAYHNNFTLLQQGVLDLFGHTLSLDGTSLLEGVVGYGKLTVAGTTTLGGPFITTTLDNGLTLSLTGTILQKGFVALGADDAGAKVTVQKTGIYQIDGNYNILDPSSVGSIVVAGTFEKSFGGKTATVYSSFTSAGAVKVQIGTLLFDGLVNYFGGSVSGAGTLGIGGGQTSLAPRVALTMAALDQQSGVLVLNNGLAYAGNWDMTGGVLNLNSTAATLSLTGQADFDGGTITGYGGTILVDGVAHAGNVTIGGPDTLTINGALDQTANINFGLSSNPTANIAAGASWIIEGDSTIFGFFGLINNSGTLIDPNGSGNAVVQPELLNTGTITVDNSTLTLSGAVDALGGTLNGSGLLDLNGGTTLEAHVVIDVASLAVDNATTYLAANTSYANNFAESGNFGVLDLEGHVLTLSGRASLDAGLLTDGGTLTASGTSIVGNYNVGGTADLLITGVGEQTGTLNLDPQSGEGNLTIGATGAYTLDDDVVINGPGGIFIAGTLTAAGTGVSVIGATVAETGLLRVNDLRLQFGAGGNFAGRVTGGGTLELSNFGTDGLYTLASGASLAEASLEVAGNATVSVATALAYAGLFQLDGGGTVSLGSNLTLSGTNVLDGTIGGNGTLFASGSTTLNTATVLTGATLSVSGPGQQIGVVTLGGELVVAAGGAYTLDENAQVFGAGTLAVAGTLTDSTDGTAAVIGTSIVDTGTIAANLGTLNILGSVTGGGSFSIGGAGDLQFSNTSTITASTTVGFSAGGGDLVLFNEPNFNAIIGNFTAGDVIELYGFDAATLGEKFNMADTQMTVSDGRGDSIVFTFATAQNPSLISTGTGPHGYAAVTHL